MTTSDQPRRAAALLLTLFGLACSDAPTTPAPGTIRVSVTTLGGDPDVDGYEFVVDAGGAATRRPLFPNGTGQLADISVGPHTVALDLVAENCTVSSPHPRTVTVISGQTTETAFEVVCVATGIAVTARTTGVDAPNTYDVLVNGGYAASIASNGSEVLGRLPPGSYTVALRIVGDNCTVAGAGEVTIDVVARATTSVLFEVTCVAPVRQERIAFVVENFAGNVTARWIGLVNPDGTAATTLVAGHSPAWSPDGKKLLYSTTDCDEFYYYYYQDPCTGGLFLIDPETRNVTELTAANDGLSPTWAPTGDRIVFRRCCEADFESTRLYVLALDAATPLVFSPGVMGIDDLTWSPDGERIAFSCYVTRPNRDLCVVNKNGGDMVRLTNDPAGDFSPAWSPDGARIAFSRQDGTTQQIVLLTVETGVLEVLTTGRQPAWSRDGGMLVFADAGGLHTINVDGSNRTRLTTGGHDAPTWRP